MTLDSGRSSFSSSVSWHMQAPIQGESMKPILNEWIPFDKRSVSIAQRYFYGGVLLF